MLSLRAMYTTFGGMMPHGAEMQRSELLAGTAEIYEPYRSKNFATVRMPR